MLRRRQGGGGPLGGGGRLGGGGPAGAVPANVYQMRQRMFSIGDDYWIENGAGQRMFKVDGKALRIRSTLSIEDASGRELFKIQEKMVRIRDTMDIEGPNGGGSMVEGTQADALKGLTDEWVRTLRRSSKALELITNPAEPPIGHITTSQATTKTRASHDDRPRSSTGWVRLA